MQTGHDELNFNMFEYTCFSDGKDIHTKAAEDATHYSFSLCLQSSLCFGVVLQFCLNITKAFIYMFKSHLKFLRNKVYMLTKL